MTQIFADRKKTEPQSSGLVICPAVVEIARSLRRKVTASRLPIAPFLAIRICFGFRASDFGFPAPPGCVLRVSAVPLRSQVRLAPGAQVAITLKTAVGTTDYADNTDEEGIAVPGVFTRRVAARLSTMMKPVPIRVIREIRGFCTAGFRITQTPAANTPGSGWRSPPRPRRS